MVIDPTSLLAFALAALALALAAIAIVLRPLWHGARGPALAIGAGAVVAVALLYLLVGTPAALDPVARQAPETMEDAIAQLESELARSPQQAEGWRLLGRAYRAQDRTGDSAAAFERAADLLPDDPDVLVEAAEARALARADRRLDARAVAWLDQALAVAPGHQRARWFRGIAHRQAGAPAEAARTWEPLLAGVDAATATSLREQVDLARADAGLPPLSAGSDSNGDAAVAGAVRITVDVAPALAGRVPPEATLYVIARQAGGPPMPVAVERQPAAGFPVQVSLDDDDSLMPTLRLSQVPAIEVVARISASGDATAAAGDITSAPVRVEHGGAVALTLDRVVE